MLLRHRTTGKLSYAAIEMSRDDSGSRRAFQDAVLAAVGAEGYRQLTVQKIIDRAGFGRSAFYRHFSDKADCFSSAYEVVMGGFVDEVLTTCRRQQDWGQGYRSALEAIGELVATDPLRARALLIEIHVQGGEGLKRRADVFKRLMAAVDTAREREAAATSPPPITAAFVLGTIEAAAARSLMADDPGMFASEIPDLVFIAVSLYFGPEAARATYEA